jgi:hypothetical protein
VLESGENERTEALSLTAAVDAFVASRLAALSTADAKVAPEDGQIRGQIGALMGLSKADRQLRAQDILAAFHAAWIAAGGVPRAITPKKARVEKRKTKLKQIKTKRAQSAKIAAANQAK